MHFKFRSVRAFSSVDFSGQMIELKELKKEICTQKKLDKSQDFDFQITDAQNNTEYTGDTTPIPRNTSVLVARLPAPTVPMWLQEGRQEEMYTTLWPTLSCVDDPLLNQIDACCNLKSRPRDRKRNNCSRRSNLNFPNNVSLRILCNLLAGGSWQSNTELEMIRCIILTASKKGKYEQGCGKACQGSVQLWMGKKESQGDDGSVAVICKRLRGNCCCILHSAVAMVTSSSTAFTLTDSAARLLSHEYRVCASGKYTLSVYMASDDELNRLDELPVVHPNLA